MTKLNFESNVLRPCFVIKKTGEVYRTNKGVFDNTKTQKVKALFHRWYEYKNIAEGSMMIGGPPPGQVSWLYAVVEYENGQIGLVEPQNIIFVGTENKMKEYDFGEVEDGACR